MKKNVELEKLMSDRAAELAQYKAEMEKKEMDIEMVKAKMAREIRFKAQLTGKEYDLLSLEDGDSASNEENSIVKNDTFPLELQLPKQEQIANWIANCHKEYGLFSDAQKIEFLRNFKFASGERCDVVARSARCLYEEFVANLGDRNGQPATVATACTEKLTG